MNRNVHVHFVCRGNTYRSRLAAAYFHSVAPANFRISSSGVHLTNSDKTVSTFTVLVAKSHGLSYQMYSERRVTTASMVAAADIVVCMDKDIYDYVVLYLSVQPQKCIVWNVEDMGPYARHHHLPMSTRADQVAVAEKTFVHIKKLCDGLNRQLRLNWVDIVDKNNRTSGIPLPIGLINDRGYWHRGVHAIVMTPSGKILLEKRSNNIVFSPGMVDVSLGGSVDSGETPLQAIARETREELGLATQPHGFRPLFAERWQSYHPHYHKVSKIIMYTYLYVLPENVEDLKPQASEVAGLLTVSQRQMRRALRKQYVRHFGRLDYPRAFYSRAVKAAIAEYKTVNHSRKKQHKQVK